MQALLCIPDVKTMIEELM